MDSVGTDQRATTPARVPRSRSVEYVEPLYDLTKADVILSLDADFLSSDGALNLRYMRQFARAAARKRAPRISTASTSSNPITR